MPKQLTMEPEVIRMELDDYKDKPLANLIYQWCINTYGRIPVFDFNKRKLIVVKAMIKSKEQGIKFDYRKLLEHTLTFTGIVRCYSNVTYIIETINNADKDQIVIEISQTNLPGNNKEGA